MSTDLHRLSTHGTVERVGTPSATGIVSVWLTLFMVILTVSVMVPEFSKALALAGEY